VCDGAPSARLDGTNRFLGRHCIAGVIHRDLMAGFGKSDRDRSADAS
jgi:hypothetical protein